MSAVKSKGGRPTTYSLELASIICSHIANGESIRAISAREEMPAMSSIFLWLSIHKEFAEQYARAKEEQAELLADEIVSIADEEQVFIKERDGGMTEVTFDSVAVARNRLRIDARKWVASKLKPKKYGDKLALGGADDLPAIQQNLKVEFV